MTHHYFSYRPGQLARWKAGSTQTKGERVISKDVLSYDGKFFTIIYYKNDQPQRDCKDGLLYKPPAPKTTYWQTGNPPRDGKYQSYLTMTAALPSEQGPIWRFCAGVWYSQVRLEKPLRETDTMYWKEQS